MKEHDKVAFLIQVGTAPLCLERGRGKILINVWCEDFPHWRMVAYTCHPRTQEAEAGRLRVEDQPGTL